MTNSKPRRRCATELSSPVKWGARVVRYGVELTCLKSFTNLPLKSNNASATDRTVDAFGSIIKKNLWEAEAEARRQTTTRS